MKRYHKRMKVAKAKTENLTRLALEAQLPMEELIAGVCQDIEVFAAELGLSVIQAVMEAEIERKLGPWGRQRASRHGHQLGYVAFGGRKVSMERPRLRDRQGKEVPLASYRAFQDNGKLQAAVARQLTRQCSSRDYEGAIERPWQGSPIPIVCNPMPISTYDPPRNPKRRLYTMPRSPGNESCGQLRKIAARRSPFRNRRCRAPWRFPAHI